MAGTVPELICIDPGKAKFVPLLCDKRLGKRFATLVFIAVWRLQKKIEYSIELKNKARAFFSLSKLELLEYSEQP